LPALQASDAVWRRSLNTDRVTGPETIVAWSIPDFLQELLSVEPHLVAELIQLFLKDASADLARLSEQIRLGDMRAVSITLHSLKGSAKQIGGLQMGGIVEEMECNLRSGKTAGMHRSLPGLETAFRSLCTEMEHCMLRLADGRQES
jgi:HPt (histidine-containing phosphotransfer) domain-containing protein